MFYYICGVGFLLAGSAVLATGANTFATMLLGTGIVLIGLGYFGVKH